VQDDAGKVELILPRDPGPTGQVALQTEAERLNKWFAGEKVSAACESPVRNLGQLTWTDSSSPRRFTTNGGKNDDFTAIPDPISADVPYKKKRKQVLGHDMPTPKPARAIRSCCSMETPPCPTCGATSCPTWSPSDIASRQI
jgi:hypothetical protein